MNNNQSSIQRHNQAPFFYEVCFFEKPHAFYTYQSEKEISLYALVSVPFGRSFRVGLVWQQVANPIQPSYVIKHIDEIVADKLLTMISYQLIVFCTNYYGAPLQEVLSAAIPSFMRKTQKPYCSIVAQTDQKPQLVPLTDDQLCFIQRASVDKKFHIHLLRGITGSGKTRCYLELIQEAINRKGNVLLMVPEINLTPQLLEHLQGIKEASFFVYHSQLTPKKRIACFQAALSGQQSCIFLTTRSGIFLPIERVQLIIVDEEHDVSYKQQEGSFRYHARDLAIKLAQLHDCPCVLGSATPSLKMMDKAIQHQVQYSVLNKRATGQSLPDFKIIPGTRATWAEPLNFQILKEIRDSLHSNHQVLFYLNRRGYVPRLFCVECKETLLCKSCLIPFVYHLDKKQLSCHYCGRHTPAPTLCSTCHNELLPLGFGTERLAEFLKQAFPSYPVFVIDTDHLTTHKQVTEQLDLIKKEKAALIIGTQMIGKGHDWPLVRLAVLLISAHHLENDLNDQVAQHIVQAAGRCGRHAPGTVIIPVHHDQQVPDLLTDLLKHDYESYSKHMLTVKKQECSPPYTHQAKILFRSKNLSEMLSSLRELARPIPMVLCQGPLLDYPMKRGVYWQAYLLINTSKRVQRDQLLTQMINQCQHDVILKKIYHALDIDPC